MRRVINYELLITDYELRIINYELRIINYELSTPVTRTQYWKLDNL
jgi:hypothetical protein